MFSSRYGQRKPTHVYRLVTDNSLEKKIYDRQVNKQGMADRIVDEMNPDAHLSTRDVHSLICEEAEDAGGGEEVRACAETFTDPVMRSVLRRLGDKLTRPPFAHESLLVDRKDNKLSAAEKKLAEKVMIIIVTIITIIKIIFMKAYKLERTSKITYSRPSYAAFYPKPGSGPATNLHNPGSRGITRNRYYEHGKRLDTWLPSPAPKPVASVRPMVCPPPNPISQENRQERDFCMDLDFPTPSFTNVLTAPPSEPRPVTVTSEWSQRREGWGQPDQVAKMAPPQRPSSPSPSTASMSTSSALEALKHQGVGIQQVEVPRDLVIPTGHDSPPVSLVAGQTVMVIKTPKGIYLRLDEKIIKIKQPAAVQGLLGCKLAKEDEDWPSSASSSG